ncbi:TPA: polysaccharide biosynthesis C-terminal domain-containing protein [Vibrio cholerae]
MIELLKRKECWALFEKSLKLLSTFILIFFISPRVEESSVGLFFLIESSLYIIIIIIYFGTDSIANKFFVDYPYVNVFQYLIKLRFLILSLVIFILFIIFILYDFNLNSGVILTGLTFLFFIPMNIYEQYSYYKGEYLATYKFKSLLIVMSIFIRIIGFNSYYFIELMILTLFLETIPISLLYTLKYKSNAIINYSQDLSKEQKINLMKNAVPAFFASISILIYSRIDQYMLALISEINDVAKYGILVKLSDSFVFIPVLIGSLYLPKAYKNNFSREFTIDYFRLVLILAMLSTFCSIIIYIIYSFYNKDSSLDVNSILIYQFSILLNFIGTTISQFQVYSGKGMSRLIRIIVGMILNVFFNFLLIENYGVLGCIISTVLALFISNIVFLLFTRDRNYIFDFVYASRTIFKFSFYNVNRTDHV